MRVEVCDVYEVVAVKVATLPSRARTSETVEKVHEVCDVNGARRRRHAVQAIGVAADEGRGATVFCSSYVQPDVDILLVDGVV